MIFEQKRVPYFLLNTVIVSNGLKYDFWTKKGTIFPGAYFLLNIVIVDNYKQYLYCNIRELMQEVN